MRINLYASGLCSAFTHSCETWTMTESVTRTIIFLYKHMAMGQFSKVFRNPMNRPPSRLPQIVPAPHRSLASSYQKEGFYNSWNQTDDNKATGPDQIPGELLKTCANELASVFAILFQASLDQGIVPDDWKLTLIPPLFKKADKSNIENYRPISLTSVVCC